MDHYSQIFGVKGWHQMNYVSYVSNNLKQYQWSRNWRGQGGLCPPPPPNNLIEGSVPLKPGHILYVLLNVNVYVELYTSIRFISYVSFF